MHSYLGLGGTVVSVLRQTPHLMVAQSSERQHKCVHGRSYEDIHLSMLPVGGKVCGIV